MSPNTEADTRTEFCTYNTTGKQTYQELYKYLFSFFFRVHNREVLQRLAGSFRAVCPHSSFAFSLFCLNRIDNT